SSSTSSTQATSSSASTLAGPGAAGNAAPSSATATASVSSGEVGGFHLCPFVIKAPGSIPGAVAVRSCDTIAEVRERLVVGCAATARPEAAIRLRGSQAFAVERSLWATQGTECRSLAALERILGHFVPC
ncbi:unnamed protein product, partial [Polarella glacialis]